MTIKNNIAISETGFVYDPTTGESFTFNPTGMEIFGYLRQNRSFEEISEIITNKYFIDEELFERYYTDFISMLKHYQLLNNE